MNNINKSAPAAHLMLDLETLGTKPGSVILEIGACLFWPDAPEMPPLGRKWQVCPRSCVEKGMTVDVVTLLWWLSQPREAQAAVLLSPMVGERMALWEALEELDEWASAHGVAFIWGKGPSFDVVHLEHAYRAVGSSPWWKFFQERCVRTIYDLAPEAYEFTKPMVAHDALCDAVAQANNVLALWVFLKRCGQRPPVAAAPASAQSQITAGEGSANV